jgi:hypothetical protein
MENDGRMNYVTYHFPKLNSKKVQTKGIIQYYMIGKENEPNVSYKKGSSHIPFVSEKMYICAKQETSAILIVENRSVTNTDKKLFLCVPLITKEQPLGFAKKQSRNILDDIIQDIQTNFSEPNNDIHLDSVLPENTICNIIETRFAIVVYLKTPIPVYSYFTGLDSSSIPGFIREYRIENIISDYGQGSFGTQQLTHNGASHPDEFGQRAKHSTTNFEDDQRTSEKFGESGNMGIPNIHNEIMDVYAYKQYSSTTSGLGTFLSDMLDSKAQQLTSDTTYGHRITLASSAEGQSPNSSLLRRIMDYFFPKKNIESSIEGLVGDNPYTWMECDTVSLDYSGNVPTYSTPIDTTDTTKLDTNLEYTTGIMITLLVLTGVYVFIPIIYKWAIFLMFTKIDGITSTSTIDYSFVTVMIILTIILWISAASISKDNTKTVIQLAEAGAAILAILFCSIISIYSRKSMSFDYFSAVNRSDYRLTNTGFSIERTGS